MAGCDGPEVVPCFWQRGGPLGLANDTPPHATSQITVVDADSGKRGLILVIGMSQSRMDDPH
jgi:hypothetical protein